MLPKYNPGDRVSYPHLNRTGLVRSVVNKGDDDDVAAQGFRYTVQFGNRGVWSVLEANLRLKERATALAELGDSEPGF
ncbi:MAG: hypothetical protein H0U59_14220 [Gemmatimonadaceae bacterium]|nr:hypothetical protein [Gemmatimonadaceae bacterium]